MSFIFVAAGEPLLWCGFFGPRHDQKLYKLLPSLPKLNNGVQIHY